MPERKVVPAATGRRHRAAQKRSKTGCRTCRARRIKCDEGPGSCRNCTSTGRTCDGYDLHRLPIKRGLGPIIGVGPGRCMTSDEKRGLSYFQHHLIPNFVVFFDSPLWQESILQSCHADPAVSHAVNMFSAIHQDAEATGMPLAGVNWQNARHRFAMEQASRSYALLRQRRASVDPQFRHVMLLCCLLFVMSEVLLGQYANAIAHLRGGLRLLQESKRLGLSVCGALIKTFTSLNLQSMHAGVIESVLYIDDGQQHDDRAASDVFHTLEEARQALGCITDKWTPFVAKCWRLSETEIMADYEALWLERRQVQSAFEQFMPRFELFCETSYTKLSHKEQRGTNLIRIQYLGMIMAIKTSLRDDHDPNLLVSEQVGLLSANEALMENFFDRPTFSLEPGIIGGLYSVASKCPDLRVRCRAIEALRSWPRYEGMLNSQNAATAAVKGVKMELHKLQHNLRISPTFIPTQSGSATGTPAMLTTHLFNLYLPQQQELAFQYTAFNVSMPEAMYMRIRRLHRLL
ncbi:C6 zinc finger domain protein [Aspergillus sclerotioniger CBS 115572]|uniref:C6 zinc finger domain protein n=1 Tax=Aspergillus sclerotioniger CBS 115572 TaxID=1450535 RepID=A0A317X017_9EURO|nr:C6 zinc finger domain protein [Aspergillus sclerotioniger CBS 115572]PWY90318.1 C6 zinc finger domain protein [Aspergillus sclerotioniger CBS 115572]